MLWKRALSEVQTCAVGSKTGDCLCLEQQDREEKEETLVIELGEQEVIAAPAAGGHLDGWGVLHCIT